MLLWSLSECTLRSPSLSLSCFLYNTPLHLLRTAQRYPVGSLASGTRDLSYLRTHSGRSHHGLLSLPIPTHIPPLPLPIHLLATIASILLRAPPADAPTNTPRAAQNCRARRVDAVMGRLYRYAESGGREEGRGGSRGYGPCWEGVGGDTNSAWGGELFYVLRILTPTPLFGPLWLGLGRS
jgi:hypothetical protein